MKKFLLIILSVLLYHTNSTAGVLGENVEIDGFIYTIRDNTAHGRYCRGDAWMTGMTDRRYEEACETSELSLPSFVIYEGGRYSVMINFNSEVFRDRDFSNLETIHTTRFSMSCLNGFPNLKSIMGGTEVRSINSTMWNLPELRDLELPTEGRISSIYWSFWNVGIERLVFSQELSIYRPEVSFLSLPNLIELSLCQIDYCDSSFKDLPLLEEITFLCVPNNIVRSFQYLPVLKRIIFKRWNDANQINISGMDSFDEVPLLKDVYIEEVAPCELAYAGSSFDPTRMTLHVPVGSRELYAAAEGWKDFGKIVEYDPAGLEVPEADTESKVWSCNATDCGISISAKSAVEVEIITLEGMVVRRMGISGDDTASVELSAGVYIVTANGHSAKVCVH